MPHQHNPLLRALAVAALCLPAAAGTIPAKAVATFESIGLYYDRPEAEKGCQVRYRAAGAADWREGYPLVYDARLKQYRGSLVGLTSNTKYEIRLEAAGDRVDLEASTRSEEFPV